MMLNLDIHGASLKIPYCGTFSFHDFTLKMSFFVFFLTLLFSFFITRKISLKPSLKQSFLEFLVGYCYDLVVDALGTKAKHYFPFISSIFIFVLLSNFLGIIPGLKSPTEDLNVCLSLGLMVFFVSHFSSIKNKGFINYLKGYTKPFFVMFPLNILGEIGQTFSHSFRLFGNIFGGSIIFLLIPVVIFTTIQAMGFPDLMGVSFSQMNLSQSFVYAFLLPFIGGIYSIAYAFFGLFSGLIQALVFTMLATVYISMQTVD